MPADTLFSATRATDTVRAFQAAATHAADTAGINRAADIHPADTARVYHAPVHAQRRPDVWPANIPAVFVHRLDSAFIARLDSAIVLSERLDSCLAKSDTTAAAVVESVPRPDFHDGLQVAPRTSHPGHQSGFLIIIALLFVVMTANFRPLCRLLTQYVSELWNERRRDNVFDEHPAGDTRVLILLIMQSIVCVGLLLYSWITRGSDASSGAQAAIVIAVIALYYLVRVGAYNLVGYTFAPADGRRLWLRGFNASQALLGIALVIPAVIVIFYPEWVLVVIKVALALYILGRIIFIYKGIRIFYDNFVSLFYFILYLCTLEIIPVFLVYRIACSLVD